MLERFFTQLSSFPQALGKNPTVPWEFLLNLSAYFSSFSYAKSDLQKYPNVIFENPSQIQIGANVIIEPNVYIKGPCIIEDEVVIQHGAYLKGRVLLQKGARVGHASEVKHAIFRYKAVAGHFNYVGDSILGIGSNLGAGVICANLRLDRKEIWVTDPEGKRYATNLPKMGAIVGDGVSVGCNTVLSPGTTIEKESQILPLTHGKGWIGTPLIKENL